MDTATQTGADEDIINRIGSAINMQDDPVDEPDEDIDDDAPIEASDDSDEPSGDEEPGIEIDASELATMLDLDPSVISISEDGRPVFVAKVDGKELPVSLGDMLKSYQIESAARQRLQAASEQYQQFEQERQQATQNLVQSMQMTGAVLSQAEQMLIGEYTQIDWNALRANDPAEYAAKQQEFNQRNAHIQGLKQQVSQYAQAQAQQHEYENQLMLQNKLTHERQALREAIPEWRDAARAKTERAAIKDYLRDSWGFNQYEVDSIFDHRHVGVAREAMLYRQLMAKKGVAQQKLDQAPKRKLKPGAAQPRGKAARNKADIASRQKQLRKTGSLRDAAALLESKLF